MSPNLSAADELKKAVQSYNTVRNCVDKGTLCHAPENSMYFVRDGSVTACCYSREAPIGRYPDQTLSEIWNGARARSMRSALRRNELPAGCELCYPQIVAGNYEGFLARGFDAYAVQRDSADITRREAVQIGVASRYPSRMEFELSNKCNLECAMCSGQFSSSIRRNREKLPSLPEIYDDSFLEQLIHFLPHLKTASFVGGEPFLIDIYYKIWDQLASVNTNCAVSITTNGTVYNNRVQQLLQKLNCQINISLDSVTRSTYEAIRVNARMDRTLANLDHFIDHNLRNSNPLTISVCPVILNCRELPDLVEFANHRGIRVFFNTVTFPLSQSIRTLPSDDQYDLAHLYKSRRREANNEIEAANWDALTGVACQIEYWADIARSASGENLAVERCLSRLYEASPGSTGLAMMHTDIISKRLHEPPEVWYTNDRPALDQLRDYYQAISTLHAACVEEGLGLTTVHSSEDWSNLLRFLNSDVNEAKAQLILAQIRPSPLEIVRYFAETPMSTLIDQTRRFTK